MLEKLQAEMAALSGAFSKGQAAAEAAQNQYSSMTKGLTFSAPPASKGMSLPLRPPSKGGMAASKCLHEVFTCKFYTIIIIIINIPISVLDSVAATMQLEAAMCPLTMYELGKYQKLSGEQKQQLDSALAMNSLLSSQKNNLEGQLSVSLSVLSNWGIFILSLNIILTIINIQVALAGKKSAEDQAKFNAKYAAEQKNKADMLASALALANAEKAALEKQKVCGDACTLFSSYYCSCLLLFTIHF